MDLVRRVAGGIYLLCQIIGAFALIGLMLVIGGTVIYRWFGGTFQGSYEVAETFTIVTITMAIFMATVNRSHVDVRIVFDRFPKAGRRVLRVVVGVMAVIFWALATYSVYRLAHSMTGRGEITDVLRINIVPFRWVTVTGFAAVTLVLAWQTWRWVAGDDPDDRPHDPMDSYDGGETKHGA